MSDYDDLEKVELRTDSDGEVVSETPWAERVGENLYRLENTPFFAYGMSYGDTVETEPQGDGFPLAVRVVEKSGNRTVRVLFPNNDAHEPVMAQLDAMGCSWTGATPRYICVNIPPEVELDDIVRFLSATELEWEHADPTYEELHGVE